MFWIDVITCVSACACVLCSVDITHSIYIYPVYTILHQIFVELLDGIATRLVGCVLK